MDESWRVDCMDCLPWLRDLPTDYAALTVTSPPYEAARTYGIGFKLRGESWVNWLAPRIVEACRVTAGLVCVNMAGQVRKFRYSPAVEWLVSDLTRQFGIVCGPSPYCYRRAGIPGSGSSHYHRRDWEPVYAFAKPSSLPLQWSDNIATGAKPKSLEPPHRKKTGISHRNGKCVTVGRYSKPSVANPGNVIDCAVGHRNMGSVLAHKSEAPFAEKLVSFFVRSYAAPDAVVIDPFCGSGTTLAVSLKYGRRGHGCDIRPDQVEWARERCKRENNLFSGEQKVGA